MDTPIRFDLSKVTYSGLLEVLGPVVPGAILAVGVIYLDPSLASELLGYSGLGYRTKIFLACLAAYIAGLLLHLMVGYTAYTIGFILGHVLGGKLDHSPQPWRRLYWRQAARKFLGSNVGPSTDELYIEGMEDLELRHADEVQDESERNRRRNAVVQKYASLKAADLEWYWWYQILNSYFSEATSHGPPARYFLAMLHSAAWSAILLMCTTHHHQWFVWVVCLLAVLFANLGDWFQVGLHGPDPYGVALAAKILRATNSRGQETTPSSK